VLVGLEKHPSGFIANCPKFTFTVDQKARVMQMVTGQLRCADSWTSHLVDGSTRGCCLYQ